MTEQEVSKLKVKFFNFFNKKCGIKYYLDALVKLEATYFTKMDIKTLVEIYTEVCKDYLQYLINTEQYEYCRQFSDLSILLDEILTEINPILGLNLPEHLEKRD